jgi:nitrogen fixation protein FixH/uncharacterized membrane protein
MLVDASASHAGALSPGWLHVLLQWVHVLAVGAWMGGLAALLLCLRGLPGPEKARAARRFSTLALGSIALVAATGVIRAAFEMGSWSNLLGTGYGQLVLAKSAAIVVLFGLGALNRFRNVPRAGAALGGLRRVGSTELGVAAITLALAATLVNVAPPVSLSQAAAASIPILTVSGNDLATTVRVRLTVSPGTAGFNRFSARITDYNSGAPVRADLVSLSFSLPSRADVGQSTLTLRAQPDGTYSADGGNLSLDGTWSLRLLVQRGAASTEVSLSLTPRCAPQKTDVAAFPGQPTLYTVHLCGGDTLQVYLDPGRPGADELHATYFDAAGNELPISSVAIAMTPPGGHATTLQPRRLESGHFVADATLARGRYGFALTAVSGAGEQLRASVSIEVGQ